MNLRRLLRFLLLLISAAALLPFSWIGLGLLVATGCGTTAVGASAPPVSLPAPVTGRLTVTSSDEDGVALVIGDDGAVPADSLVHAVNDSQTTASTTLKLVDLFALLESAGLVTTAEAQTALPALCSQSFHGCAIADSAGSFELEIQASDDDEIGVEILDPTAGTPISERLTHAVPHNIRNFVRPVIDVAFLNHTPSSTRHLYALMGSTIDDPLGRISIVDLPTNTRHIVSFAGTHPDHMAVNAETRTGAIVDSTTELLSVVDLVLENFDAPLTLSITKPRDVIFNTSGSNLILASASSTAIRRVDPVTLGVLAEIGDTNLAASLPGATNTVTLALDLIPFTHGGVTSDLVAFAGVYDVGGTRTPAVGLLENDFFTIVAMTPLPTGADPRDVAFYRTQDRLLVTDVANNKIWIYSFVATEAVLTSATLTLEGEVTDPGGIVIAPQQMMVDPTSGLAFVNAKNGTDIKPDTVLTVDLTSESVVEATPVGLGPTGLVFDPVANVLFVSTSKTHSITFWGLPDLLP